MKRLLLSGSVIAATAGIAHADLDRSGQVIGALFEKGGATGSYFEVSFANVSPDVTGTGLFTGYDYGNVGEDYWFFGTAIKVRFNDQLSGALIFDQPYGSDIVYGGSAATTEFGGTKAIADTNAITALLRYHFNDRWSAHGGARIQMVEGEIGLSGLAYGPVAALPGEFTANGYDVNLDQDTSVGYVIGAAYEIPEIALRVALTYSSEISHDMETKESGPVTTYIDPVTGLPAYGPAYDGTSTTEVKTPQSVNLDLQTGIAADTLLFGSVRWVEWSAFRIDPKNFFSVTEGSGLVELSDTTTYQLGVGHQFTDRWDGSVAVSYQTETDDLISPLSPRNGYWGLGVGAGYTVGEMKISGGVRYTWLGDAEPQTAEVARADFDNNNVLAVGFRIGYNF